jgi:YadA-like membrane anchor domain
MKMLKKMSDWNYFSKTYRFIFNECSWMWLVRCDVASILNGLSWLLKLAALSIALTATYGGIVRGQTVLAVDAVTAGGSPSSNAGLASNLDNSQGAQIGRAMTGVGNSEISKFPGHSVTGSNVINSLSAANATSLNGIVGFNKVANAAVTNDVVNVSQLRGLDKKLSGGIAASMAMTSVTAVDPGQSHVSVTMSVYNGQAGLGLGWLKRSINGQWTANAAVAGASGGAQVGVRIGAGFTY